MGFFGRGTKESSELIGFSSTLFSAKDFDPDLGFAFLAMVDRFKARDSATLTKFLLP